MFGLLDALPLEEVYSNRLQDFISDDGETVLDALAEITAAYCKENGYQMEGSTAGGIVKDQNGNVIMPEQIWAELGARLAQNRDYNGEFDDAMGTICHGDYTAFPDTLKKATAEKLQADIAPTWKEDFTRLGNTIVADANYLLYRAMTGVGSGLESVLDRIVITGAKVASNVVTSINEIRQGRALIGIGPITYNPAGGFVLEEKPLTELEQRAQQFVAIDLTNESIKDGDMARYYQNTQANISSIGKFLGDTLGELAQAYTESGADWLLASAMSAAIGGIKTELNKVQDFVFDKRSEMNGTKLPGGPSLNDQVIFLNIDGLHPRYTTDPRFKDYDEFLEENFGMTGKEYGIWTESKSYLKNLFEQNGISWDSSEFDNGKYKILTPEEMMVKTQDAAEGTLAFYTKSDGTAYISTENTELGIIHHEGGGHGTGITWKNGVQQQIENPNYQSVNVTRNEGESFVHYIERIQKAEAEAPPKYISTGGLEEVTSEAIRMADQVEENIYGYGKSLEAFEVMNEAGQQQGNNIARAAYQASASHDPSILVNEIDNAFGRGTGFEFASLCNDANLAATRAEREAVWPEIDAFIDRIRMQTGFNEELDSRWTAYRN